MTRGVHVSLLDESTSTNLLLNESYTDCISTEYSAFENQGRSPASTNAERLKRKFHKKLAVAQTKIAKQQYTIKEYNTETRMYQAKLGSTKACIHTVLLEGNDMFDTLND